MHDWYLNSRLNIAQGNISIRVRNWWANICETSLHFFVSHERMSHGGEKKRTILSFFRVKCIDFYQNKYIYISSCANLNFPRFDIALRKIKIVLIVLFQNFSGVDDGWWSVKSSSYSPTPLHLPNTLPIDPSESGDCKSSVSARLDERFNPSRSLNRRWMGQVYAKLNGPTFQHTRSIRSLNYPTDSPFSPIYSFHSQWQRRRLGDRVFSFHVTVYRFLMGCRDDRGQCEKPATPSSLYIYMYLYIIGFYSRWIPTRTKLGQVN